MSIVSKILSGLYSLLKVLTLVSILGLCYFIILTQHQNQNCQCEIKEVKKEENKKANKTNENTNTKDSNADDSKTKALIQSLEKALENLNKSNASNNAEANKKEASSK